jgi:hypothetical protein
MTELISLVNRCIIIDKDHISNCDDALNRAHSVHVVIQDLSFLSLMKRRTKTIVEFSLVLAI